MKEPKASGSKFPKVPSKKLKQGPPKFLKKSQVKATTVPREGKPTILTRAVAKGQFQKVSNTLVLRAGEALDLRCKGKAVKWRYPPYLDDDDVERRLR